MTEVLNLTLDLDNEALSALAGPLEANLRQIGTATGAQISRRGNVFRIEGELAAARKASSAIEELSKRTAVKNAPSLTEKDVQLYFVGKDAGMGKDGDASSLMEIVTSKGKTVRPKTPHQGEYLERAVNFDISFGVGPAGTGKTYLAVACAVSALEHDRVERIVLTRPAVEAGERLGFLPGDLTQKVDPYLRPLYDALFDLIGFEKTQRLLERQAIEIAPLAYMRGRTLNNAFVILDEAQNTTREQMKMFLTRIGFGSKAVITGDVTQVDLPRGVKSGLTDACHVLSSVRGIAFTYFTSVDVVRHPLVARIVNAYEKAQENEAAFDEKRATEKGKRSLRHE